MATETLYDEDIGTDGVEENEAEAECRRIRSAIERQLYAAVGEVYQKRHADEYLRSIGDSLLEKIGAKDAKEKLKLLRPHISEYLPKTLEQIEKARDKYRKAISLAGEGITKLNIQHMQEAFRRGSGTWEDAKAFFGMSDRVQTDEKFKEWHENWKKIAGKISELRAKQQKFKFDTGLLKSEEFKSGKVEKRLELLDAALDRMDMYSFARDKLISASKKKVLTLDSVDRKLAKIFSGRRGEDLKNYVYNLLPAEIGEWAENRQEYTKLFAKCKEKGISVMSETQFLSLRYPKRREEVVNLQKKLRDTKDPDASPIFGLIQKNIDGKDFTKARWLMDKAENSELSQQDKRRLAGYRLHLREQTKRAGQAEKPSPYEEFVNAKNDFMINLNTFGTATTKRLVHQIDEEGGHGAERAQHKGDMWRVLAKGYGNVKWGVQHNWIDEKKLHTLRENAEDSTKHIQKHGHRERGAENIKFGVGPEGVQNTVTARPYEQGHRGVTFYHFGKDDTRDVIHDIRERKSHFQHNYWFDLIPEDATLAQIMNFVNFVLPKLKKYSQAEQKLQEMGATDAQFSMAA